MVSLTKISHVTSYGTIWCLILSYELTWYLTFSYGIGLCQWSHFLGYQYYYDFLGEGGGGRMLQVIIEFVWSVDCEERMRSKRICCLSHWSFELCLYRSRKKMKRRGEGVRDLFVARMKQLFWIWGPKKNEQQQHLGGSFGALLVLLLRLYWLLAEPVMDLMMLHVLGSEVHHLGRVRWRGVTYQTWWGAVFVRCWQFGECGQGVGEIRRRRWRIRRCAQLVVVGEMTGSSAISHVDFLEKDTEGRLKLPMGSL